MAAGSERGHGVTTAAGLALALAVAAGGCATDDPREGGFVGGVMGLLTGQYARNVETKRARLDELRAEERGFGDEARRLEEERNDALVAAERRRAMAAALARRSAELDEQLRDVRRAAEDAERERAEVLSEVERLEDGEPSGLPPPKEGEEPGPAPAAAPPSGGGVARLLEEATELEEQLGTLQEEAARAQDERARLRAEIDRLNQDLTRARGASPQPEGGGGAPEG